MAVGIVLVRGLRSPVRPRDLALALSVGACIAGYTLVDKHGIVYGNPLAYLEVVFGLSAIVYLVGAWRVRGGAALRAALGWRTVLAGVGFFGAYALTLAALRLAPAASVAAVRESSVLIAAAVLAVTGRENVGAERLVGAVAVVAGIALDFARMSGAVCERLAAMPASGLKVASLRRRLAALAIDTVTLGMPFLAFAAGGRWLYHRYTERRGGDAAGLPRSGCPAGGSVP